MEPANNNPFPPLHIAATQGNLEAVERLLRRPGIDVNEVVQHEGWYNTPLQLASEHNRVEVVNELLAAGADPNLPRFDPPLHSAASLNSLDILDLLIAGGADLDAKITLESGEKVTAMAHAIMYSDYPLQAVRKLIAAGADVNAGSGVFPLGMAVMSPLFGTAKLLLKAGANPCLSGSERTLRRAVDSARIDQETEPHSPQTRAHWDMVATMVAAGNRCWPQLPTPCPRLERALPAVGATSQGDLPELFQRLEEPIKARIRCTLLLLRRRIPEKRLRGKILAATLADVGEAVPLAEWLPDAILDRIRTLDV